MAMGVSSTRGRGSGQGVAVGDSVGRQRAVDSSRRMPALDGLRAISIAFVLFSHAQGTAGAPDFGIAELARIGVRIFFVLSGFLITTLLLAEHERTGRISIVDFYIRRFFRIFPALYLFVGVMVVLDALRLIELHRHDALSALTYTVNYRQERSWWLGHIWSLSVEEQFYLMWPAVLVLLGTRRSLWFVLAALAAAPFLRVGVWILVPSWRSHIDEAFPTVFDSIATGCLLARVRGQLGASPVYRRLVASALCVQVRADGLAIAMVPRVSVDLALGQTVTNVAIALSIDWCLRHS